MKIQEILGTVRKACQTYDLIEENDKIAVGLSGGKDSLMLLSALAKMQGFYPKKYTLLAIGVDLFSGETDYSKINLYCQSLNVPFIVIKSDIKSIVFDIRKESNPCSLCAKMRRGILNSAAKQNGCTKVALGHHSDDLIETFFLSMFYEGRLSTFSPKTYLSNTDITVIRPLLLVSENDIIKAGKDLPILTNNCPANHHTKREEIKEMINNLKKQMPHIREQMLRAIISFDRYNLFDKFNDKNKDN